VSPESPPVSPLVVEASGPGGFYDSA
jgi:hypothetical protein